MEWERLLNAHRFGETSPTLDSTEVRSEFDRDADRVMFSGPFRRLSRKTQVHPLAANDHVHTRLTHSLETGQVGRSLARRVYPHIPKDGFPDTVSASDLGSIVQAACLAHDIGNPPFGHAGEEAMDHWFAANSHRFGKLGDDESSDLARFDGNAQGFRILTQIENHVFSGGMRLTHATLGTFLKYPTTPKPEQKKFSVFRSEEEILAEVARALGLTKSPGEYARHPLAYLVEAADDICYCVLDVEDAVELKIVPYSTALELLLSALSQKEENDAVPRLSTEDMFRVNFSRLRGHMFRALINGAVEGFVENYAGIVSGEGPKDLFAALGSGDRRHDFIGASKRLGKSRIYVDAKKVEVELGAFATLDVLLTAFTEAALECSRDPKLSEGDLGWKSRLTMRLLGDHAPRTDNLPGGQPWTAYQCCRRAVDFVSGMTDNYATYMAKQIAGMGFAGIQRP